MNCTICSNPIDSHLEGRETDRCVAAKLRWHDIEGPYKEGRDADSLMGYCPKRKTWQKIPFYSSPDMTPETWGLVERIDNYELCFKLKCYGNKGSQDWYCFDVVAPTAPLAICRAFLAKEEGEDEDT